jgi:hypothetical protein
VNNCVPTTCDLLKALQAENERLNAEVEQARDNSIENAGKYALADLELRELKGKIAEWADGIGNTVIGCGSPCQLIVGAIIEDMKEVENNG